MKHPWAALGIDLSPEQDGLLSRFEGLLREVAAPRGFVARGEVAQVGERHVADSLRALPFLRGSALVRDLGSGAGLPGIPLAIAMPDARFELLESKSRRIGFLELAVERLGLTNVSIRAERVAIEPGPGDASHDHAADACTARALADLPTSWAVARGLLRPSGRLVYFAGVSFDPSRVGAQDLDGGRIETIEPSRLLAHGGPMVIIVPT